MAFNNEQDHMQNWEQDTEQRGAVVVVILW